MKSVRVIVPASAANLGPGFDTLGIALSLNNQVVVRAAGRMRKRGECLVSVEAEGEGAGSLPRGRSNLTAKAALRIFEQCGCVPERLSIKLLNRIPLARGLGSSAAAVVGGLVAANHILGRPLSDADILRRAVEMEGHPDNVAAALYGGLCITARDESGRVAVVRPRLRNDLACVACVPEVEVPTSRARRALPRTYRLRDVVFSLSRTAMLTAILQGGPLDEFSLAMQDRLHQPYRAKLAPGIIEAMEAALKAGALGACISGAGPTVLAFCSRRSNTEQTGEAMVCGFRSAGTRARFLALRISRTGARISAHA